MLNSLREEIYLTSHSARRGSWETEKWNFVVVVKFLALANILMYVYFNIGNKVLRHIASIV